MDITRAQDFEELVQDVIRRYGKPDYLFNNAGIGVGGEIWDMKRDHWRRIVDVNIWGVINGTIPDYRAMVKQGFGHIVNTASLAGIVPAPGETAYSMSKHAVVGLSLLDELTHHLFPVCDKTDL